MWDVYILRLWSTITSTLVITELYLISCYNGSPLSLQHRHNKRDDVPNHQPHDCLLKRLFQRRSKKTSKLRVTVLCVGNSPMTQHKGPVTRKMFPFDDVIIFAPCLRCEYKPWHGNRIFPKTSNNIVHGLVCCSN